MQNTVASAAHSRRAVWAEAMQQLLLPTIGQPLPPTQCAAMLQSPRWICFASRSASILRSAS
jgi:hypothetical protein